MPTPGVLDDRLPSGAKPPLQCLQFLRQQRMVQQIDAAFGKTQTSGGARRPIGLVKAVGSRGGDARTISTAWACIR